jgi:hypothetical protein
MTGAAIFNRKLKSHHLLAPAEPCVHSGESKYKHG